MNEKDKNKLLYIAHPYTGDVEANMLKVNTVCNQLLDLGYMIYSPLTMNHPLHMLKNRDYEVWINLDFEMLKRCDVLVLCGNWKESKGCNMELTWARDLHIEIAVLEDLL
jgi:hypothetical protein